MATVNFSGIASGIDSASLIDSIVKQRRQVRISPLEEQKTSLEETNSSVKELKELLSTLRDKADSFRVINGGGLKTSLKSSDEQIATATSKGQAASASYQLTVLKTAKNGSLSFNNRFTSPDAALAPTINEGASTTDKSVSFKVGTGSAEETVSIELSSTTTASDLVQKFNSLSKNASASLVNLGTNSNPSYAINVVSKNSGLEKGSLSVSVGSAVSGSGALVSNTISQAQNSEFSISGISGTISRSTNSVSDVIQGVTLNLQGPGSTTLQVESDAQTTTKAVDEFVKAYNKVVSFIKDNDQLTQTEVKGELTTSYGPLNATSVDETIRDTLRGALSGLNTDKGGSRLILADLGITTERDGTLKLNEEALTEKLQSNPEGSKGLLEGLGESLGGFQGKISQFIQFQGLIDKFSNSSNNQVTELDKRISEYESAIDNEKERLTAKFSKLESLIGSMNSQQATISRLLR